MYLVRQLSKHFPILASGLSVIFAYSIFLCLTDLYYVTLETKAIVARWAFVDNRTQTNNTIRPK
jgi:hypothetical protein